MNEHITRDQFLAYNANRNSEARRHGAFRNELKYFRRIKPLAPTFRFLDAGCGPGLLTEFMIDQGVEGAGVDIDQSLVKAAKTRVEGNGKKAGFVVGRVEQLPYRDQTFDICVANSILEHAIDWQATLREITRVLKTDGLLVFYTTNCLHPFQDEVNHFPFYSWIPGPLKTPILAWIMKHRPDLVNYTDLPAIHWFSYRQVNKFMRGLGYRVSTRLDLVEQSDLVGWKAIARPVLSAIQHIPPFRYLYYFYSRDTSVYAIKLAQ
jgi:2-polyprenyl-6-hydroxyphenyl methylase/3-demethylubiquinone-9 3-methyltransferase